MSKRVYFKHLCGSFGSLIRVAIQVQPISRVLGGFDTNRSAHLSRLRDVLLCLSVLVPLGLTAQPNIADTFRILPIFDALTGSYPTDQFVAEATRLKAQVGQNRENFKVGFSFIYPGYTSTRRYCQ